jgi:minor extracellular serine protease Vpr
MKRILLFMIAAMLTANYASAQSWKLSPYTQRFLTQHSSEAKKVKGENTNADKVDLILRLSEGQDISEIEAAGVEVVNRFGQLLTVRIPIGNIDKVSRLRSVKTLDIGCPHRLTNDSSRIYSNVDILQKGGESLGQQYTGKGVIVGVIDEGIDYNHINFKDASGHSRVKLIFDGTNIYTDTTDIARQTTDLETEAHGTHTTGIAAGSYSGNGLQGMAPEADLVLCGLGEEMTDAKIINSIKTIFDYADKVGKPAVINMSLGGNSGPHDGTDDFSQMINSMKKEGHIMVIAAGNEAESNMFISHKSENETDSLQFKTILDITNGYFSYDDIDLWEKSSKPFYVRIAVINAYNGNVMAQTPIYPNVAPELGKTLQFSNDTTLNKYFKGTIAISSSFNGNNNRYNNYAYFNGYLLNSYSYKLALMVYSKPENTVELWSNNATISLKSNNLKGYTDGNDSCSANSMAYSSNTINVGAYITKKNFYSMIDKSTYSTSNQSRGDIAYYSSYGIKADGTSIPDIVAPGSMVESSFNTYLWAYRRNSDEAPYFSKSATVNGKTYYWGAMEGTSMATPAVTGIIAQWLQYKPTLTIEEIKDIFRATAIDDDFVKEYNHVKSGMGKIDAYEGLKYILTTNIGNPQCAQHQVLIYPSSEQGKINIYAQGESGNLHIDVYSTGGMKVYSKTIAATDGSSTIDLNGRLVPGMYIVKVAGTIAKGCNTLVIK